MQLPAVQNAYRTFAGVLVCINAIEGMAGVKPPALEQRVSRQATGPNVGWFMFREAGRPSRQRLAGDFPADKILALVDPLVPQCQARAGKVNWSRGVLWHGCKRQV